MSCCDLWPVYLESLWYIRCYAIKVCTKFEPSPAELLIIWRIFAHVVSRCDLDLWPLDLAFLQRFGCQVFKLCTKFERKWIMHSWVINDLAPFVVQLYGVRHFCPTVLRSAWTNFSKLGEGIQRSFLHKKFVLVFRYLAAFLNVGAQSWLMLKTMPNFALFDPLWKSEEG